MNQNNFDNFFRICEEIIDSSLAPQEDQENYNAFFKICDDIIDENLQSGSGANVESPISEPRFNIISDEEKHCQRFNVTGRKITFIVNDPPIGENSVAWFYESLRGVVEYVMDNTAPNDYVGFIFRTPRLEHGPGWLSFRRADQLHIDVVWEALGKILQSNKEIFSDGQFTIELTKVSAPSGSGKLRGHGLTYAEFCRRKHGILEIINKDNLCLPRALVVADSWVKNDICLKYIVKDTNGIQGMRARELLTKASININENGAGIPELTEFQRYYTDVYNICVYEHNGRGNVIFEGAKGQNLPRLNLLYHQNHYSVIKSLTAVFSCRYFCEQCHVPYNVRGGHSCENLCFYCKFAPACPPNLDLIKCDQCQRKFRGQTCFDNHLTSVCKRLKKCTKCLKIYQYTNKRQHVCGEVYCKFCETYKNPGHMCYILKDNSSIKDKSLFIYYDFETRQEKKVAENKEHEVNLCVAQQSCSACCDILDIKQLCNKCGVRQHIFKNDPLQNFLSYVLLPRTSFTSIICIAHNAKSFDCQFILKYLVEQQNIKPKLILNGSKIMLLQINHIKFIDSLNYLPMSLTALPKAMDLPDSLKKGYFPHFFNKLENQNYVGSSPPSKYYGVDSMSINARQKFLEWYNKQVQDNVLFDLDKEIIEYCMSDVNILRQACEKFRKTFIEDCKVCPFTEAVTIASACNRVFRRLFIEPTTIGIIPQKGYRLKDNQSKIALQWLIHQENTRGIRIQHAGHGAEAVIGNIFKVDGYYATDKLVFEFFGCFWHGCTLCYRTNRNEKVYNNTLETLEHRYQKTIEKLNKIRNLGYTVISIWECEFRKILKNDKNLQLQLNNHQTLYNLPLQPRDAFFGGRTGNTCLYKKAENNEKIKYVDVCSLYPYVCKYGKYPVGHPEVFVGAECDVLCPNNNIDKVEGLIKCTVLPPSNLFHPVLPRKVHDKLMFALCRVCKLEKNDCTHTDTERQFIGTWVADELRRAVSLGYQIIKVHEVWQYKVTQYNRDTKTGGLFVEFINTFLKMKQEASGYPVNCENQESKTEYIQDYFKNEGIQLDPAQIKKNSGKRSVAKLMLNSFWGKFAQSESRSRTTTVSTAAELYELLSNPAIQVQRIIPAGDKMLYVNWLQEDEALDRLPTVNVVIAAYTTAQARLRLHEFLEPLGRRVLYYDTDSIIYSHEAGQYEPSTGNLLGDLTDELSCYGPDSYITEFVCGGPKNYAYRVYSPTKDKISEVCKVKGFTLNYKNSNIINFSAMKNLILTPNQANPVINSRNIRCTIDHTVLTKNE